jgi:hypothetical protein
MSLLTHLPRFDCLGASFCVLLHRVRVVFIAIFVVNCQTDVINYTRALNQSSVAGCRFILFAATSKPTNSAGAPLNARKHPALFLHSECRYGLRTLYSSCLYESPSFFLCCLNAKENKQKTVNENTNNSSDGNDKERRSMLFCSSVSLLLRFPCRRGLGPLDGYR